MRWSIQQYLATRKKDEENGSTATVRISNGFGNLGGRGTEAASNKFGAARTKNAFLLDD
jgi:hypothetical protein